MSTSKVRIDIPPKAEYIVRKLKERGYEGFVVGGCVRDAILGRTPNDWDITTSATPDVIHGIFAHTVDTGVAHGTVTVLVDHEPFEVTTYRIDGAYEDGRHPKQVTFTPSLKEDLKRRDFTINAMAYNDEAGLVDLFSGREDLENGIVRCVGVPADRFGEDALRMMRAVRFAAQLQFSLDEDTARAVRDLAPSLARISAERIQAEMMSLLVSAQPDMMDTVRKLGLSAFFLPEFDRLFARPMKNRHHDSSTVGDHTLRVLRAVPPTRILRLAALLHDIAKPDVAVQDALGYDRYPDHAHAGADLSVRILRRLKFDKDTMERVRRLIWFHSVLPAPDETSVRCFVSEAGADMMEEWLELKEADIRGQNRQMQDERLPVLEQVRRIWHEIEARGDCLTVKELALTGQDLIDDGMQRGKQIGDILALLLQEVLRDPSLNTRQVLLEKSRILRNAGA